MDPKPLMKCNLKASRGFARIGNTVHREDFATKLLVTLAHPQNKGASRTVRDALVNSFIAGGNIAALLLPCDKTIYSIAEKVLRNPSIEKFVINAMNVEDEFSRVPIDGTYKVPMSLVGQPKHGTQKQSFQRSEKHVLETILSKTSCVLDIVPLFSERSSIVIDAVCASLGDRRKNVLVLKADNASNHDNANTFKKLKNLQGIRQDPLHRAFEVEAEFGGHRNQLSRTLRSIVHKFRAQCRERNPVYYTYRTQGIDKFQYTSTYDKKLQGMTKRNANALIANIDPESPFRKPPEYFELLAAAVVKHDALVRDRPKLKGILRNAATVMQIEYLVAFGPARHRAWVVGQMPLACSLGYHGRPLWNLWGSVLRPLGDRFGAS